jgi:hypothetical protein
MPAPRSVIQCSQCKQPHAKVDMHPRKYRGGVIRYFCKPCQAGYIAGDHKQWQNINKAHGGNRKDNIQCCKCGTRTLKVAMVHFKYIGKNGDRYICRECWDTYNLRYGTIIPGGTI